MKSNQNRIATNPKQNLEAGPGATKGRSTGCNSLILSNHLYFPLQLNPKFTFYRLQNFLR